MTRTWMLRFGIEVFLASASAFACVMSLIDPQWIETLFEASPDGGDGSAEWGLTLGLLVSTLVFGWLARADWRRARLASNAG